jgi:exodeoxyribonuclease-3
MRVITFNANGIRSAAAKGFFRWLEAQDADVICLQETRARIHQLNDDHFFPPGTTAITSTRNVPGYAGTAIFSRVEPDHVQKGLGWEPIDSEGRWIQADYKDISVVSLYMPSGSSGEERQAIKFALMDRLMPHLAGNCGARSASTSFAPTGTSATARST